ncbi:hypothetical protein [Mucilaginibacter terrae]|uniref:DUF4957 domain-containing protein n=1 Tax=Mucilaginibacter terrae TaxID=1955052 RepID=A0ABU3GNS9_9SPHI|nr:hypothetical protein [Mucilaginibacter terrae]MDT3401445.1 hypothetical protein [Mucilaginibacter terrae]
MKFININKTWLPGLVLFASLFGACKKDNAVGSLQPSRAFIPTGLNTTTAGTTVKIDWKASLFSGGTGVNYTLEVSKNAAFTTIDYIKTTDAVTLTLTDDNIQVGQPYYARVKANSTATLPGSNGYVVTSSSFTMPGILQTVTSADLTSKTVTLRWLTTPDVTKITITPLAGGAAFDVALSPADVTATNKLVTGLTGDASYRADIYSGTRIKGFTTFKTPLFTKEITSADNLIDVINNASNGDIIGLADGTYDVKDITAAYANITIQQKNIGLQGKSGDASKVIINFKQIDIKGTGAGFSAKDITFDGTAGAAQYFLNLIGNASDAENATFTNINIDGCVVSNVVNAFLRGNRATNTNGFVIGNININNTLAFNINKSATAGFNTIELSKVQFAQLNITNSTFYEFGRNFIVATTVLNTGTPIPSITIDKCTFNSFGGGTNTFVFADANANAIKVAVTNSIIANSPRAATIISGLFRGTGVGSSFTFTNNNTFALLTQTTVGSPLPLSNSATTVTTAAITNTDLGWVQATTNFALPAGSALRTASTTGGAIGDPRWAK